MDSINEGLFLKTKINDTYSELVNHIIIDKLFMNTQERDDHRIKEEKLRTELQYFRHLERNRCLNIINNLDKNIYEQERLPFFIRRLINIFKKTQDT